MNNYEIQIKKFTELNHVAKKGSIVIFGSSFADNIPASELTESYGIDLCIYKRSISDLSVFDLSEAIQSCITEIQPNKVFIQLGETDLASVITKNKVHTKKVDMHLICCITYQNQSF